MRSRSASKQGSRSMEVESPRLKEDPHLSGAYIRSLVKKLSSSMPKGPMNSRSLDGVAGGDGEPSNLTMTGEGFSGTQRQKQQEKAAQPRKQVRRRVHTSKPYQERIINMAEARKEIVTALKFHRATMKRAREQQEEKLPQEEQPQAPCPPPPMQKLQKEMIEREDPRLYPSNNTLNVLCSYFNNPSLPSASYPPISLPYNYIAPLPIPDNLKFSLPSGPLGLNLNIQDFDNVDMNLCNNGSNPPRLSSTHSTTSSSSCSYSFSSPMTSVPFPGPSSTSNAPPPVSEATSKPTVGTLHPAMGVEEMAEIRSIGERHDLEWNDKLNLVKSARWCELLKTMEEVSPQGQEAKNGGEGTEGNGLCLFDEVLNVPAWLNDQQVDGYCNNYPDEYLQDVSLPCLDIGELEGMNCEWLS